MKIEILVKELDEDNCKVSLNASMEDGSDLNVYDLMENLSIALINLSKDYDISEKDFFKIMKKIYKNNEN